MPLDTLIFDPSPCGFPKPHIPLLPTGLDGVSLKATATWAPADHFRHYTRGRYALREAYRLAGIGPGSALLAPSYHCRTMLDPALALGGDVLLYPLQPDLSPEMAAIESLVANSSAPVKALLVTHFFGIPKPLEQLAAWCAERGITLVEDCSHAFFTEQHRPADIGIHGDFVASSPYKFLPSPDGGLLYARDASALDNLYPTAPSWLAELRGIAHQRAKAAEHRRNRRTLGEAPKLSAPFRPAIDRRETAGLSSDYRTGEESRGSLRTSRWLYQHADNATVARHRREHYQRWSAATQHLPHRQPLSPAPAAPALPPVALHSRTRLDDRRRAESRR